MSVNNIILDLFEQQSCTLPFS